MRCKFGVALSVGSVGRLLKKLDLSAQRLLYRAYQQNPEAVEELKTSTYPAVQTQAEAEARRSTSPTRPVSAATSRRHHLGLDWADPGGRPPVPTIRST
ncbi:MAG: helix-turn-helix domain-containing protein [Bacteroidota bacterium]